MARYGKSKMPNEGSGGSGGGGKGSGTNRGPNSGLRKENTQRADVLKKPSSKNPYPRGLC